MLEAGCRDSPGFLRPEKGWNACDTPCTDWGGLVDALLGRQRLGDPDRPATIDPRHLAGYTKQVSKLYQILGSIIDSKNPEKPDWSTRWMKYSGTKREHYRKCALEQTSNPLCLKPRESIIHIAAVKWGELSARARALLVQTIMAIGCDGVKPGTPLRVPIMIEGGYRDLVEDALHKYSHKRKYKYVASGMDLFKRGRVIEDHLEPGDLVLSLDWTSFDGSLGELAVVERNCFLKMMEKKFGRDNDLRVVIETQNFCRVQGGPVRAKIYGNRGSGTAGTSTGNKVVVLAAIAYCLGPAFGGGGGVKLLCDGDDTLIFVPKKWRGENDKWVKSWVRRFSALGLETKVQQKIRSEDGSSALSDIRFCRAGVIRTCGGPFLCKEPFDALKVLTNFRKHFQGTRFTDYLQTLSVGLKHTYSHVPVIAGYSQLFDVGGRVDRDMLDNAGFEYMMSRQKEDGTLHVTEDARHSFHETFGVSPSDQVRCELALLEEKQHLRLALTEYLSP